MVPEYIFLFFSQYVLLIEGRTFDDLDGRIYTYISYIERNCFPRKNP
jgi:hypothetical protein